MARIVVFDFDSLLANELAFDSKTDSLLFEHTFKKILDELDDKQDQVIIYSMNNCKDDIAAVLTKAKINSESIEILGNVETNDLLPGIYGRMISKALLDKINFNAELVVFVTCDRCIVQSEHVICILVPHSIPAEVTTFKVTDNYLRMTLLSDDLLKQLKKSINAMNTRPYEPISPSSLSILYDKLTLQAYKIKRSANGSEYYSIWSRFFGGSPYSKKNKLEACETIESSLDNDTFDRAHLPKAAENGELSTIVARIGVG